MSKKLLFVTCCVVFIVVCSPVFAGQFVFVELNGTEVPEFLDYDLGQGYIARIYTGEVAKAEGIPVGSVNTKIKLEPSSGTVDRSAGDLLLSPLYTWRVEYKDMVFEIHFDYKPENQVVPEVMLPSININNGQLIFSAVLQFRQMRELIIK